MSPFITPLLQTLTAALAAVPAVIILAVIILAALYTGAAARTRTR